MANFKIATAVAALLCLVLPFSSPLAIVGSDTPHSVVVQKLRTYCAACHALGTERFIWSDEDEAVWNYLYENDAPMAKKRWSQAILEVLNWPTETPPPFDQMMVPPDQDWMPKGFNRLSMAQDSVDGTPVRKYIYESLRQGH